MKVITISLLVASILTLFSCDTEDARTPLGITISAPDFELVIEENPEENLILGTLTAIASDESVIQFGNIVADDSENSKFESETPIDALDVDNETGELFVKDATAFDYDINTEINATINAISGNVTEAINISIFINPDRRVLIELFEGNTENTLDWDITETDISNWTGVTLTDDRVTALDISGSGLSTITESISKLSDVTDLNLSNNSITIVPESLASLGNLTTLNISNNDIEGELPEVICTAFTFDDEFFIKDEEATCTEEEEEEEEEEESTDNEIDIDVTP